VSPAVPHFELEEERSDPGVHVVSVSGEIHVSTAPSFRERLNAVIESGETTLVLDLSAVDFIDSTGLSVLLNGLRLVTQRHGRLALVCTNPTVMRLFEITSLDATFDMFHERDAAIAHLTQPADGSSDGAP
jgi:anti-sigma B factor antagonist